MLRTTALVQKRPLSPILAQWLLWGGGLNRSTQHLDSKYREVMLKMKQTFMGFLETVTSCLVILSLVRFYAVASQFFCRLIPAVHLTNNRGCTIVEAGR